jgi:hypothetical protein
LTHITNLGALAAPVGGGKSLRIRLGQSYCFVL